MVFFFASHINLLAHSGLITTSGCTCSVCVFLFFHTNDITIVWLVCKKTRPNVESRDCWITDTPPKVDVMFPGPAQYNLILAACVKYGERLRTASLVACLASRFLCTHYGQQTGKCVIICNICFIAEILLISKLHR
jgi:hypothetical protein